ncbi:hypothetical protein [Streptacidiphilus sp. EB129]|uniref:hypothetical protein n=1 Tax=Streptacidiphilus sp. EB129 TaxID=3156262 RepID=UPI00351391B0
MRTSIRHLIQALFAAVIVAAGLLIPTGVASANSGGTFVATGNTWGVGLYVRPDVNAPKNPTKGYVDLRPGGHDGAYVVCKTTGVGFGGASATWYQASSIRVGVGDVVLTGWVFAPFLDGSQAANWLPTCESNGGWFQIQSPHHLGQYSCAVWNVCIIPSGPYAKNGPDLNPGQFVYGQCYVWGNNIGPGTSTLWFLSSNNDQYGDQTGAYVYAPFLGYTSPPSWMSQCAV